jgi:hypothetical protein
MKRFQINDRFESVTKVENQHRHAKNIGYEGLISLEDSIPPSGEYKFRVPTVVPRGWKPKFPVIDQKTYIEIINTEYPYIRDVFKECKNVILAGGAAAFPLTHRNYKTGDVDLFIYGIDPTDMKSLWNVINNITRIIRRYCLSPDTPYKCISESMTPGLITMIARSADPTPTYWRNAGRNARLASPVNHKIQIILRAFPSPSSIVHGFDVASSRVLYNGNECYTSGLARYAFNFGVNLVDPSCRSTTYEHRLGKYFDRGFGIALPNLKPESLISGKPLKLPHIEIHPKEVVGNLIIGTIKVGNSGVGETHLSDYDINHNSDDILSYDEVKAEYFRNYFNNMWQVVKKSNKLCVYGISSSIGDDPLNFTYQRGPQLEDLFDIKTFEEYITISSKKIMNTYGRVNGRILKKFGVPNEKIKEFAARVFEASVEVHASKINVLPAAKSLISAAIDNYNFIKAKGIDWWIVSDPSRQYTVSLNPLIENPEDWYGKEFTVDEKWICPEESKDIEKIKLLIMPHPKPVTFNEDCPLCTNPISPGDRDTLLLPCGHIFHLIGVNSECVGMYNWILSNQTCPVCRKNFNVEDGYISNPHTHEPSTTTAYTINIDI